MQNKHIVERLIIYNRALKELRRGGAVQITSESLGDILSKTSSQIRRDLSEVGKKGKPGVGYVVDELIDSLDQILGLHKKWGLVLVGAGNLGRALFYYPGFKKEGFQFRAVIDSDPGKKDRDWSGVKITGPGDLKKEIAQKQIDIGVIAVPSSAAQDVAWDLVSSGVKAILNFAPVSLDLPESVFLRDADLAMDMENLSCFLNRRKENES
ncbi:MAG: redox-sensing transcriptional repressor Rex [Elusimicrobiota bacterium]